MIAALPALAGIAGALGAKELVLNNQWFARRTALFGQAQVLRVTDRNFVSGNDGWDTVLLLELTRSFR